MKVVGSIAIARKRVRPDAMLVCIENCFVWTIYNAGKPSIFTPNAFVQALVCGTVRLRAATAARWLLVRRARPFVRKAPVDWCAPGEASV